MATGIKFDAGQIESSGRSSIFWEQVRHELASIRSQLDMDVAFISEFDGDKRVFRVVDAKGESPIAEGATAPLDAGYCQKIADGRLPQFIPDARRCSEARKIRETRTTPIGTHLSIPIRLPDSRVFGTLCCFNFVHDPKLAARDLEKMRPLAKRISDHIETFIAHSQMFEAARARIEAILDSPGPSIMYQPIYALSPLLLNGAEALARFEGLPRRTPDLWFEEAEMVGLRTELELKAIENAVKGFRQTWKDHQLYLGLNSSPQTILRGGLEDALAECPLDRVVVEITEHAQIEDYGAVLAALRPLRDQGVKLAVDDAGAGFASFRHILYLQPDIIKVDVCLTRGVDADKRRRALVRSLISFARETDGRIVAEGIETAAELETLCALGASAAQGYYLGKPVKIEEFVSDARRLQTNGEEIPNFITL